MTPQQVRALFEASLAARQRSLELVDRSRLLSTRAHALRHAAALRRRSSLTISTRGAGYEVDGAAIQIKVASGVLPRIAAAKTIYRRGTGKVCCACDLIIGQHEIEVEANFEGAVLLRFHVECFTEWQYARRVA